MSFKEDLSNLRFGFGLVAVYVVWTFFAYVIVTTFTHCEPWISNTNCRGDPTIAMFQLLLVPGIFLASVFAISIVTRHLTRQIAKREREHISGGRFMVFSPIKSHTPNVIQRK